MSIIRTGLPILVELIDLQAWWGRKEQAHGHYLPPSIQGEWLTIDDKKNKHFSFTLSCWLFSSKLVAKARNETLCLLRQSYFCSYVCVYVVSQFDLSITKWNCLFVTCQSLSHIPNTSLQCSNQQLWKLNLMTGVNTTEQQTGKIKNTIKSVI